MEWLLKNEGKKERWQTDRCYTVSPKNLGKFLENEKRRKELGIRLRFSRFTIIVGKQGGNKGGKTDGRGIEGGSYEVNRP